MKKIKILHVDDNIHDTQLVKEAFSEEVDRFDIITANSRDTLEKHLEDFHFDLVLSDFNILGFDGFQVLEMARKNKPETPVIIVTGTGSEEIAVQAMKMGADDYVIKTTSHIRNLVPTVNTVLEKKRKEKEFAATLEALKESEERFRLLFDNSLDAVLLTQPDGSIKKANPAACKIFGKNEAQIIREGRNGIVDLTDPRLDIALKQRAINGSFIGELTGIRSNGERFPIEVSSTLFIDKNGKQNSSMIIRDISERKTNEEEINKKLAQFERFHQLTVDRELMMIELKKEVNELLQKLGLPEKYK